MLNLSLGHTAMGARDKTAGIPPYLREALFADFHLCLRCELTLYGSSMASITLRRGRVFMLCLFALSLFIVVAAAQNEPVLSKDPEPQQPFLESMSSLPGVPLDGTSAFSAGLGLFGRQTGQECYAANRQRYSYGENKYVSIIQD